METLEPDEWLEVIETRSPNKAERVIAIAFHGLGINWLRGEDRVSSPMRKRLLPYAIERRDPLGRRLVTRNDGAEVVRFATRAAARAEVAYRRAERDRVFGSGAKSLLSWRVVKGR